MTSLLIRNATIVDPSQNLRERSDIAIRDGVIEGIGAGLDPSAFDEVLDADGLTAIPGLVDIHAHLREPGGEGAETIATGVRAAARGGFTTVFAMPNTSPVCDSPHIVRHAIDRAREAGNVRVLPVASVTRGLAGEELCDYAALLDAGAGAFSDDGRPVASAGVMRRAMQCIADLGAVILDHCEDMSLTGSGVMHEGEVSIRLGLPGIPRSSEATNAARNCALSLETGARLHICHVSNRETVAAIRFFRDRGAPITAEVSPHHLTLTDEAVARLGTMAKMKPPLCDESDRQALIEALEDGTIDCIATDHAPHAASSKKTTMDEAPFGIIGMEAAFPVLHREFVTPGRWTLGFLVERMTSVPARVVGLDAGRLRPGSRADVTLIRTGVECDFDEGRLGSKSRNCPWLNERMDLEVAATIAGGRIEHRDAGTGATQAT